MTRPTQQALPLRRQPFENLHNVRDLGGYAVPGGMTAWGRIFRSGQVHAPTEADLQRLLTLNIGCMIDLRTPSELERHPDEVIDGVEHHHIDFLAGIPEDEEDPTASDPATLKQMYLDIAAHATDSIRRAVELIAQQLGQGGSVLFHCAVGKDRTGILAALLLSLCGVSRTDIVADYQISHTHIEVFLKQLYGDQYDPAHPGGQSLPATIAGFLDYVDHKGGTEQYLLGIGVPAQALDTIRREMIVSI